ncbi:hypothetical protein [Leifsonia shinshuensis]
MEARRARPAALRLEDAPVEREGRPVEQPQPRLRARETVLDEVEADVAEAEGVRALLDSRFVTNREFDDANAAICAESTLGATPRFVRNRRQAGADDS